MNSLLFSDGIVQNNARYISADTQGLVVATAQAHNEASSPESEHIPVEILQNNARYISADTQGLVVATLVESNRNALGTDVIVDAVLVDDKPTTFYKDRRTLLKIGIFVIVTIAVAVAVSVVATVLLLGERNNESSVVESVAPSSFDSSTPTLSSPSPPTFNPSSRYV